MSSALRKFLFISVILLIVLPVVLPAQQNSTPVPLPKVSIGVDSAQSGSDLSITLQLVFLMTILSLAPAILILLTSFTRIVIVFHFIRQALGTQQIPPNQILIGLGLFLTFYIMSPIWTEVNDAALQPYLQDQITQTEAYDRAIKPVRQFMIEHTREKDLALFVKLSENDKPENIDAVSTLVLIPAFAISELRVAFQIGFILYVPFLIIDMVVASVLMSMGMMMLPPMMISLPFKILLFILVDGWYLLVSSIVTSF